MNSAATIDADRAEANAKVDRARAYCRQLHAALAELKRSESKARPGGSIDTQIKQFEEVSKQRAATSPPSRESSEHAVREENQGSADESGRRNPIRRFNIAHARSALLRQTIGLLALTLAYLQYYYFDVQLQIVKLPSVLTWPLQ